MNKDDYITAVHLIDRYDGDTARDWEPAAITTTAYHLRRQHQHQRHHAAHLCIPIKPAYHHQQRGTDTATTIRPSQSYSHGHCLQ